jgi:hypothetical protein
MTAILGFLFSRWTFLILAVVVVGVLVSTGRLFLSKYTIGGLVLLALGIGLWSWHDKAVKDDRIAVAAPYIKEIKDNNDAAEKKLKEETAKTDAVTKALKEFSTQQELEGAINEKTVILLADKLNAAGRLRDPYQTGCSGSSAQSGNTVSAESGAGNATGTGGELSKEFDGFLKLRFMQADKINVAYASCRAYAYKVREALITETKSGGIVLAMSGELK